MIALSPEEQATVRRILHSQLKGGPFKVLLFGSRATNTAQKYSDVDLALIGKQAVSIRVRAALSEAFEESNLPYTVDIVDYSKASKAMQQHINTFGQELRL